MLLLTIANSCLLPSVCLGEECELISRTVVGNMVVNKSMVCSLEDLIYELRPLKVVCNGYAQVNGFTSCG